MRCLQIGKFEEVALCRGCFGSYSDCPYAQQRQRKLSIFPVPYGLAIGIQRTGIAGFDNEI